MWIARPVAGPEQVQIYLMELLKGNKNISNLIK
jgi:hypothetical protein